MVLLMHIYCFNLHNHVLLNPQCSMQDGKILEVCTDRQKNCFLDHFNMCNRSVRHLALIMSYSLQFLKLSVVQKPNKQFLIH